MPQSCRTTTRSYFPFYHKVPKNSCYSFDGPQKDERMSQTCRPLHHECIVLLLPVHDFCLFVCLFVFEFWVLNSDRLNKILVASVVYQSRFDGSVKNLDWQIQVGLLIICVRSIPFHALFVLTFHFLLLNFHSIHFELVGDKHCINEISTSSKAKQAVSLCNNLERKTL